MPKRSRCLRLSRWDLLPRWRYLDTKPRYFRFHIRKLSTQWKAEVFPRFQASHEVTWGSTINAIAIASGTNPSEVASGVYAIERPLAPPTFSSPSGTYSAPFTFTLTPNPIYCSGGSVCDHYYSINGDHGNGFLKYTDPVAITELGTFTVKAFETSWHYTASPAVSVTYVIQ